MTIALGFWEMMKLNQENFFRGICTYMVDVYAYSHTPSRGTTLIDYIWEVFHLGSMSLFVISHPSREAASLADKQPCTASWCA